VEGGSDGVVASMGVVLRLEVEVREGTAGMASERDEKHGAGENFPPSGGQQHPFKGGRQEHSGGGELGDSWGRVGEREGGPSVAENGSSDSGGRRDVGDTGARG
jgi:hypothetical protein